MRTLLIALLTGAVGAVLAVIGGDLATRAHHVSNMEGGRAMLVIFAIAPAGALLGIIIGFGVARSVPGSGPAGFAKAQGIAVVLMTAVSMLVFGFALWRAPRPPQLEGRSLALELQVRLPPGRGIPDSSGDFSLLLLSRGYGDDRRNAELQLDATTERDGRLVIPARALLYTTTRQRFLVVNDVDGQHYWFDLPLRARPRAADERWTDWWPRPGETATSDTHGNGGFQIRYRVQRLPPE
jgi:MFS family permease